MLQTPLRVSAVDDGGFTGCGALREGFPDAVFVRGTASSWGPALARWGTGALMVWNGDGKDTRIWTSEYNQSAGQWSTQYLTELEGSGKPIQSGSTPAMVNFNGKLLMVWRGEGDNDDLYYAFSSDGLHWQGNRQIPGAASTIEPAMVVFNGAPVLCFKGGRNDTTIYSTTYRAQSDSWAGVVPTGRYGTSHGPSLAVYQGVLFMCWKGVPGDTDLYWATTKDNLTSSAWGAQQSIPNVGSAVGPAAVVY